MLNKKLLVSGLVVALFVGGGAFAYFKNSKSSEEIFETMFEKNWEVKTMEYSGEMNIKSEGEEDVGVGIDFRGLIDSNDLENPKLSMALDTSISIPEQEELSFGLEFININKLIYVQITSVPDLGFIDLSSLTHQWVKIDIEAMGKQLGIEDFAEFQKSLELTKEKETKLKALLKESQLLTMTAKLADDSVEGVKTHHFGFTINKEGLIKFLVDAVPILIDQPLTEEEILELNETMKTIEFSPGEVWVGKNDLLMRKITLKFRLEPTKDTEVPANADITMLFKNFDQPVTIEAPKSSITPQEFFKELSAGPLGGLLPY